MIYVITGHLGSGKSLLAVALAQEYMLAGRQVASNITLHLEHLVQVDNRTAWRKLPYVPTARHLDELGDGYEGKYDETKFGLILLDEAGKWLNSRDWNDKGRRELFAWFTHARKRGWDVALIIQDFESLDAQIRRSITELYVKCSRLDRVKIPYLPIRMPRVHRATAHYQSDQGMVYKRWHTNGTDLFQAYDTREAVTEEKLWLGDEELDVRATWSGLTAWHLVGRYCPEPRGRWFLVFSFCLLAFWSVLWSVLRTPMARRAMGEGLRPEDWWKLQRQRAFPKFFVDDIRACAARGYQMGSLEHERSLRQAAQVRPRCSYLVAPHHGVYRLRQAQAGKA